MYRVEKYLSSLLNSSVLVLTVLRQ